MKLVDDGVIPSDSILLVESLDRVSRETVMDAYDTFRSIIKRGITLITLSDGRTYSTENLNKDWTTLIIALSVMARANEDNETKSVRVKKAWRTRRNAAITDASQVMTAKVPLWIDVKGERPNQTFELNPERSALVRRVVDMAKAGIGNHTIIKTLHAESIPAWIRSEKEKAKRDDLDTKLGRGPSPKAWEPSYIQKMLTHRALYGAVEVKGGVVIENYYPPIMNEEEFIFLQDLRSSRAKSKKTNRQGETVTNLFSGLLTCGYCLSRMGVTGYKPRNGAKPYKYIACHGARLGTTTCRMNGWGLQEFEDDMLMFITSIDYGRLVGQAPTSIDAERSALANLAKQIDDTEAGITNLVKALETSVSQALINRLEKLEANLIVLKAEHTKQAKKVASLASQDGGRKGRMQALVRVFKALKRASDEVELRALREQLSAAINLVVRQITLYPVGRSTAGHKANRFVDVTFVNGAVRRAEGVEVAPKDVEIVEESHH